MLAAGQGGLDLGNAVGPTKLDIIGLLCPTQAKDSGKRRLIAAARLTGENARMLAQARAHGQAGAVGSPRAAGPFVAFPNPGWCEGKGGGRRGQTTGQKPDLAFCTPFEA